MLVLARAGGLEQRVGCVDQREAPKQRGSHCGRI